MGRGDSIGTSVPAVGATETGGTSDVLTIITALVAVAETKVTSAELNIDATLDANTQLIDNVTGLEFITQSSSPGNERLWTKNETVDELYYTDSAGTDIRLTADGALSVAATGAITGSGYGSSGVALNWNAAGTNYQFKSAAGADAYAAVTVDTVQLRDGSSHHLALATASKSASETLTFPADITPAATSPMAITSTGNVQVGGDWQISSGDTQTVASGGTLDVASGGTLNLNSLSELTHGALSVQTTGTFAAVSYLGTQSQQTDGSWICNAGSASQEILIPLNLPLGVNLTSVKAYWRSTTGSPTVTTELHTISSTGTYASVAGWVTTDTSAGAQIVTGTEAITSSSTQYVLSMSYTGNGTTNVFAGPVTVAYTRT